MFDSNVFIMYFQFQFKGFKFIIRPLPDILPIGYSVTVHNIKLSGEPQKMFPFSLYEEFSTYKPLICAVPQRPY